jgi:hypothetical protein
MNDCIFDCTQKGKGNALSPFIFFILAINRIFLHLKQFDDR